MVLDKGSRCAQACLIIFTLLFWLTGFALLFLGIWMLVDPKRNYLLDLVNFSEDEPLLKFAAYSCLVAGTVTLVIGFLGCCGALKGVRCMLGAFVLFLLFLFLAELTIGVLALIFKDKFSGDVMPRYLRNLTHNRYYRDRWVTPLIDTVQYYQQCCGSESPLDYHMSYWYKMNRERGTTSFVPPSCCKQTQIARAPNVDNNIHIQPIDSLCITYHYNSTAFKNAVHQQGCHAKLQNWFDIHSYIFIATGFGFAAFQLIGIIAAICLCRQIHDYTYI